MDGRPLTTDETGVLEARGCRAEDWRLVTVADDFSPGDSFRRVEFSGRVRLGSYRGAIRDDEGDVMPAGIDFSRLHDVSVGNDCRIQNADISRTDLGDDVLLLDVGAIRRQGDAPFANGLPAHVLAEDGARSVPLWRFLTAQFAHLLCHLRGLPAGLALADLVRADARSLRRERCLVSSGCRVRRCGRLVNVWLAEGVRVDGAAGLADCFVDSARAAPTRLGDGVMASECVFLAGCRVGGGVRLERCLVGEGVTLGNAFTGRHSLFFANSEFEMGEALSVLAGPFSVSHHKASLVLACQSSFANFGSGSNSSNHRFKLGPLHGGMLRRGARCGSGSYIFWPSDIGAYSSVIGRHSTHLDTAAFPFSLLVGKEAGTVLVPGVNLFGCGMFRDAGKWRERDRREGLARPLDLVNPAILSPYTLQAMDAGVEILERSAATGADFRHGGALVPAGRVRPALRLYRAALVFHLGERLLSRAARDGARDRPDTDALARAVDAALSGAAEAAEGRWRDWGGMLLSGVQAERFLERLASGGVPDAERARILLEAVHNAYEENELAWLARRWLREYGSPTPAAIAVFAEEWREAVGFRSDCFLRDAGKEFSPEARIGFGAEGDAGEAFGRIRGGLSDHPLVAAVAEERERLLALASGIAAF